jgi:uncharacterized damage-inducible protein DinB
VRRRFALKLSELPWEQIIKNREASYYSLRNILVHMIDNEDWMVNWVIHNKSKEYKREKNADDYQDMQQVISHLDEVEKRTKKYLSSVRNQDSEFARRINLILSSGKSFDLSVEEALFQSFTEQLYHIGELIALLWQENTEPPSMQWFNNNPRSS